MSFVQQWQPNKSSCYNIHSIDCLFVHKRLSSVFFWLTKGLLFCHRSPTKYSPWTYNTLSLRTATTHIIRVMLYIFCVFAQNEYFPHNSNIQKFSTASQRRKRGKWEKPNTTKHQVRSKALYKHISRSHTGQQLNSGGDSNRSNGKQK